MTEHNWQLFQRSDIQTGLPTNFGELLWLPHEQHGTYRLHRRWGRTCTWGESERIDVEGTAALAECIRACTATFVDEGLTLIRQWSFEPKSVDKELLRAEILEGTRLAYRHLTERNGAPTGFALSTDSGAMTIVVTSNYGELCSLDDDVLWCPDEWSCWDGGEYLDLAYRLILTQHRDDMTQVDFDSFQSLLSEAMIESLADLVDDGAFGSPEAMQNKVVSFHVSADDLDHRALRRLNSPEVVKRFDKYVARRG